jgi:hypothetical protein
MQRLELSSNDTIKLLTREPLLIVRLPIYNPVSKLTHETGRRENLSRTNLCLVQNPLELDDYGLDTLKMEHLS